MADSTSINSPCSDDSSNRISLDHEDSEALRKNDIQTTVPGQLFRLGYVSIAGIIINSMIGTGVFNTPSIIMRGTQSPGITLLLWVVGAVYALAASYLYLELGLHIPRFVINGEEMGVPRSGGELNYLRFIYDNQEHPTFLPAIMFGVPFIIFADMAENSLAFAQYVYAAAGVPPNNVGVRGIAILTATFTCTIHSVSRRGGIWLSNVLAIFKVAALTLIIIVGFCASNGVFGQQDMDDLSPQKAFSNRSTSAYGYAQGFLQVLFAYSGWNQANAVLSEVKDPRKRLKRALPASVLLVSVLYILVNVVYMLIVPEEVQVTENSAEAFFRRTFGRLSGNDDVGQRILNAFMAISSLGNIFVFIFTAARVKQELAKEGILPWARFFGSGYDLSWRRLLKMMRGQKTQPSTLQETPVGALFLHWFFIVFTLIVTSPLHPGDTYSFLTGIYMEALFPAVIAIGVMYMHMKPDMKWDCKTPGFNRHVSFLAAAFVAIAGVLPIVVEWIPPSGPWNSRIPWFATPTASWAVLGLAIAYWVVFRYVLPHLGVRKGKKLMVERDPHFSREYGYPVLDHEVVRIRWVHRDTYNIECAHREDASEPNRKWD